MGIRNKKALLCFAIIILIAVLLPPSALAHSGKTDSNGGHYDSDTGEYHYHHGYPAHQHTGGKCPYDYDDKTDYNSGNSSTSSNTKTDEPDIFGFIMVSLGLGILFFLIASFVCSKMKTETSCKAAGWIIFVIWIIVSLFIGIRDYL